MDEKVKVGGHKNTLPWAWTIFESMSKAASKNIWYSKLSVPPWYVRVGGWIVNRDGGWLVVMVVTLDDDGYYHSKWWSSWEYILPFLVDIFITSTLPTTLKPSRLNLKEKANSPTIFLFSYACYRYITLYFPISWHFCPKNEGERRKKSLCWMLICQPIDSIRSTMSASKKDICLTESNIADNRKYSAIVTWYMYLF